VSSGETEKNACPFCGGHKTQIIGPAGVTHALMHFRCAVCEREWDEAVAQSGVEDDSDEEALP